VLQLDHLPAFICPTLCPMPAQDPALLERAHQVAPLLRAISAGSGLPLNLMRLQLVARIPASNAATLKRNWNRWLEGAASGNPLPTVAALVDIARAARDLGWLEGPLSADARSLAKWLEGRELIRRREMRETAAKELNAFVDELLREVDFRQYDVEQALESLFATFAAGVAHHIQRSSLPGEHGLSEAVRNGAEKAIAVTAATLAELADEIEENEFAPVADMDSAVGSAIPGKELADLLEQQRASEPPSGRARWPLTRHTRK
jgi:hypothetical protein